MNDPRDMIADYFDGNLTAQEVAALEAWLREKPGRLRGLVRTAMLECHLAELLHEQNLQDITADLSDDSQFGEFGDMIRALDAPDDAPQAVDALQQIKRYRREQPAKTATRRDPDALTAGDFAYALGYFLAKGLTSRPAQKAYAYAATALILAAALWLIPWNDATPTPQTAQTNPYNPAAPAHPTPPAPAPAHPVATLTNTQNAQWGGAASAAPAEGALAPGSELHPGTRLTLTHGFAEVTTAKGAVVILEAPATAELLDHDNAIRLHAGKLVGLCHTDSSKGFVVKTDHADITDLGTEFGVTARPDGVEASVFVGEVAVNTADTPSQVIQHSQTARVSVDQGRPTLVIEDKPATGYAQRLPRPALITDASINLPGFKIEVVPNGVYEDTRLYTDREHEINGVDASGLPSVLLGGDLVRMPADARPDRLAPKGGQTLQLNIHLSAPADLYLLIEPHFVDGNWLKRDYVRTGMTIGKDSVGGSEARGTGFQQEGGIGPGVSVDQAFEVWKRKKPATGHTTAAGAMTRGMYALIAVPAQQAGPHE